MSSEKALEAPATNRVKLPRIAAVRSSTWIFCVRAGGVKRKVGKVGKAGKLRADS